MAYIGKQPVVGNFVKLDTITTSATATYNLLNGGVAYSPQSPNHCLVSLNGILQAPTDSFTISGSTIIFSNALTTSDVIDFIIVLGDVLNIGIPSDGSITTAKLTSSLSLTTPTITNQTITNYTESVVAIGTVTTSNTISLTSGTLQTATLTASTACTFTMPTATAGKSFVLLLKQAASTGNGTATFTSVKWGTAGAPTITATAGKMDILTFVSDGTNWYGSAAQGYTP